jgi:cytochrome c553
MTPAEVKEAVRERDGQRCVECGLTALEHQERYGMTLDVHRVVPGSAYTLEGCVTLCRACHGPKPKRPAGEGPPVLALWVTPDLKEALRAYAARERRSTTQAALLLLEEILAQKGLWTPPAAGGAS